MLVSRSARRAPKHALSTYRRHAVTHVAQIFFVVLPLMIAILSLSAMGPLLGFLAGELALILVLPRLPAFQRMVDAQIERKHRADAARERAALLAQMSDAHRCDLERIELFASQIRERTGCAEPCDLLGVERLVALYVRLAIAHRESVAVFPGAARNEISQQIASAARMHETATGPVRDRLCQRLWILRSRSVVIAKGHEEREAMEEELATIVEVVRYTYERCATADTATATAELREIVENAAQTAMLARELSTVRVVDFDSAVLERGRPTPDELLALTKVRVASSEAALPAMMVGGHGQAARATAG
jgi:hypothetical protein